MLPHPPPGPARRRLIALCVAAFLALVAGFIVGSSETEKHASTVAATKPPARALAKAKGLSLQRQIGELMVIAFPGTTPPSYVRRALRQGRASGVILFRGNVPTRAIARSLTRRLQRSARGRALVATDQEGGAVRILPWAAPTLAQSSIPTPQLARTQAQTAGADLAASGVNVTLAPVADVGGSSSVMKGRAFPGGTADVAALTSASVRGYRGSHVAPTLKHFPGLGEAGVNTDDAAAWVSSPRAAIATPHLPPFQAGINAGAPLVMASHALFKSLDPNNIASQSKPILTTLLRAKLGFSGVVITDSMEAAAVLKRSSLELAALRSLNAGADLLLLTGPGSFPRVSKELTLAAKRSAKFRARIAEAAARVIALKRSLGLRAG